MNTSSKMRPSFGLIEHLPEFSRQTGNQVYVLRGDTLPSGSIKHVSVLGMMNHLRHKGLLKGCRNLVASSSGNTAVAAAQILKGSGIRFHAVIDQRITAKKKQALRDAEANLIEICEPDPVRGYLGARIDAVHELLRSTPGAVDLDQYSNCGALNGHYEITGPLIWQFMRGQIDVFIAPIGTGGTFGGTSFYLLRKNGRLVSVPADCEGSAIFSAKPQPHLLTGIGAHFACNNVKLAYRAVRGAAPQIVSDAEAIKEVHWLKWAEGVSCGGSGGAALVAARRLSRRIRGARVVVVLPDGGEPYEDTIFNETWLRNQGIKIATNYKEAQSA